MNFFKSFSSSSSSSRAFCAKNLMDPRASLLFTPIKASTLRRLRQNEEEEGEREEEEGIRVTLTTAYLEVVCAEGISQLKIFHRKFACIIHKNV